MTKPPVAHTGSHNLPIEQQTVTTPGGAHRRDTLRMRSSKIIRLGTPAFPLAAISSPVKGAGMPNTALKTFWRSRAFLDMKVPEQDVSKNWDNVVLGQGRRDAERPHRPMSNISRARSPSPLAGDDRRVSPGSGRYRVLIPSDVPTLPYAVTCPEEG